MLEWFLAITVAGAGIAPAPPGYEPDDVLLVHPAYSLYKIITKMQAPAIDACLHFGKK